MNYYEEERYPQSVITGFIRGQRNLEKVHGMSVGEAKEVERSYCMDGPIHQLYRFTDDEIGTVALAFQNVPLEPGDTEIMLGLVYIDPSIEPLWRQEMNREVKEDAE